MVVLVPISQQLLFAARPQYLSLTYNCVSGCLKYKDTTCLHTPTTLYYQALNYLIKLQVTLNLEEKENITQSIHQTYLSITHIFKFLEILTMAFKQVIYDNILIMV